MTKDELDKVLQAVFERGDRRWNTPSGAILDVLREFIKEGQLAQAQEAFTMYVHSYPPVLVFLANQIPAILINRYPPILECADFGTFIAWTSANPKWAENIADAVAHGALREAAEQMASDLRDFKPPHSALLQKS